jgi:hypothetical protein
LLQKKAKKRKPVKISSILLTALTVALPAYADLFSSTGSVSVIAPPASVVVNSGLESNTLTYFFTEQRDLVLPSDVAVNITTPGTYNSNGSLTPGTIAAGTKVDSYYLHTDPVGQPSTGINYVGSVTFDTPILGVIVLDAQFNASNGLLGAAGTLYSASGQGLELGSAAGDDSVALSIDGETLSYNLETSTAADDIRIITAASVPEPSGWILLFTCAGLCVALRRQRRATSNSL